MLTGKLKLVHVALTRHNIWAVDSLGNIFFHSGLPPLRHATWVALGSLSSNSASSSVIGWASSALKYTSHIVSVFASCSSDWMVSSVYYYYYYYFIIIIVVIIIINSYISNTKRSSVVTVMCNSTSQCS